MKIVIVALLISLTSACSIYRLGARQGNEVTAEKLVELEDALTREQVIEIMGTPLVNDPFRDNRWDYVYYYSKHGTETQKRHITVFFNGELVDRIEHAGLEQQSQETDVEETVKPVEEDEAAADAPAPVEGDTGAVGSDNP